MSIETEILKELKEINGSIEELTMCFVDGFGGTTIHQTLEDIKIINNDIELTLKRIAVALEKQNESVIKTLNGKDDAGQDVWHLLLIKKLLQNYLKHITKNGIALVEKLKKLKRKKENELR